tara:strand:+ start:222 stop:1169 length:948 start_codon:yes stop_codon:yes gene_type:complete
MSVYVNNITINTGEYFSRDFYLDNIDGTPLDLTGYTAASQMRKHPESVNATADFNVGFIDRANGRIRISLATTKTRLIKPGRYVWDLMFTDGSNKKSIVIEGNVLATQDITPSCVITSYTNEEIGFILEADGFGSGVSGTDITIDDINDYGIVRLGFVSNCGALSNALNLIRDETNKNSLVNYLQSGGVIWLNGEWYVTNGCGDIPGMNEILAALGSEIRQLNVDEGTGPGNMTRTSDSTVVSSGFPSTLHYNASATFSGGTAVYTVGTNRTVVYEKVGYGIVYVTGDTNTFDPGNYATVGQEIYNALRALVLNS